MRKSEVSAFERATRGRASSRDGAGDSKRGGDEKSKPKEDDGKIGKGRKSKATGGGETKGRR